MKLQFPKGKIIWECLKFTLPHLSKCGQVFQTLSEPTTFVMPYFWSELKGTGIIFFFVKEGKHNNNMSDLGIMQNEYIYMKNTLILNEA
jgi:hypothetical protein